MYDKILNIIKVIYLKLFNKNKMDYSTWILSSSFNTKFNYNSKYFFEYILNEHSEITPIYVINDRTLRQELKNEYGEKYFIDSKSLNGIQTILNAGVWLTSSGLPIYGFNLNKERLIINLWHGVPLKKIGLKEQNLSKITRIYFKRIFSNNYTNVLTTSKKLVPIMAESFGVSEDKVKVWGQPRNDAMFKKNSKHEILKELYPDLPLYRNIILYAPTFRDNKKTHFFPFEDFTPQQLDSFLEENKLIIFIRSHQSEAQSIKDIFGNRIRIINDDKIEDITFLLNIFDLLITDYSSIYIDYLLTEKPILFLPYDKKEYLKNRGMNFDYEKVTPGPKPKNFKKFQRELLKLLKNNDYYFNKRKEVNNFFNEVKEPCSEIIYKKVLEEIKLIDK